MAYHLPPHEIRQRLTAPEMTLLMAAYNEGLLPDPWMQTGTICSTFAAAHRAEGQKPLMAEDFLRRERPKVTAEQLEAGRRQRQAEAEAEAAGEKLRRRQYGRRHTGNGS